MALNSDVLKIAALINKKLGDHTVVTADKVHVPKRITTGSLTLDVVLGGGWPMNHWVEVVGEASHGKTAIALKTIAANQKLTQTLLWYGLPQSSLTPAMQRCVALIPREFF